MATIKEIWKHLHDTGTYHGMSFASIVQVAVEIEMVEDKEERAELRRGFTQEHSLTSQVWARVAERFPDYDTAPAQAIRGMSYCCQLPKGDCADMWTAHHAHIMEPGALGLVLADVNAELDARCNGRAARESLAARMADLCNHYRARIKDYGAAYDAINDFTADLAGDPAIAREIKRREREAKNGNPKT